MSGTFRVPLTTKLTCRGRCKSLVSRETVMRPRSGAAPGSAAWTDSRWSYFGAGGFGIASHFIRFFSVSGPFFSSHALIWFPTLFPYTRCE